MIRIEILGDVIPAARPRFSGRRAYQPARNVEYRREVEISARQAMRAKAPLKGALEAVIRLYRKYKVTARQFGDVDNHLKALFDGLQGIIFEDDAQIVRCVVEKFTDKKNPRAEIELRELRKEF
ncbi:MAG: RusA family crossover junction endodeoxyribonuclease [Selenomonadaceae bacterium]|nr:RusA family crossover junction endodeoxyribonuclease [Selenomonadaceae bacterium]